MKRDVPGAAASQASRSAKKAPAGGFRAVQASRSAKSATPSPQREARREGVNEGEPLSRTGIPKRAAQSRSRTTPRGVLATQPPPAGIENAQAVPKSGNLPRQRNSVQAPRELSADIDARRRSRSFSESPPGSRPESPTRAGSGNRRVSAAGAGGGDNRRGSASSPGGSGNRRGSAASPGGRRSRQGSESPPRVTRPMQGASLTSTTGSDALARALRSTLFGGIPGYQTPPGPSSPKIGGFPTITGFHTPPSPLGTLPFSGGYPPAQSTPPLMDVKRFVEVPCVREEPVPIVQRNTFLRESPKVEMVDKPVNVPEVQVQQRLHEVEVELFEDRVIEIPEVNTVELLRQVSKIEYLDRVKSVSKPIFEPRDVPVDIMHILNKEHLVEVPAVQYLDAVKETPKPLVARVPKHVEKQVYRFVEKVVEVPHITTKEQIIALPRVEQVEFIKEVIKTEVQRVRKEIAKPEFQIEERRVEVPSVETVERLVEVPEIEYREVIKEVPKYITEIIERRVPKTEIQYVERCVEIPSTQIVERLVEVPEIEIREVVRKVPRPIVQYVDKIVHRPQMRYDTTLVEVPVTLTAECPVEVPQLMTAEALTKVPRPTVQMVDKEIPMVQIEPQERQTEFPQILRVETPVETVEVNTVDTMRQVLNPVTQYVDKAVPKYQTHEVETIQEVPIVLQHEKEFFFPQVQQIECVRQSLAVNLHHKQRNIPKINMQYVNVDKLVEQPTIVTPVGSDRVDSVVTKLMTEAPVSDTSVTSPEMEVAGVSTCLLAPVRTGQVILPVENHQGFEVGQILIIDKGLPQEEAGEIAGFGASIALGSPLQWDHDAGALVTSMLQSTAQTTAASSLTAPVETFDRGSVIAYSPSGIAPRPVAPIIGSLFAGVSPEATTHLTEVARPGQVILTVLNPAGFQTGQMVSIDRGGPQEEVNEIAGIVGSIVLGHPLQFEHGEGTPISSLPQAMPVASTVTSPLSSIAAPVPAGTVSPVMRSRPTMAVAGGIVPVVSSPMAGNLGFQIGTTYGSKAAGSRVVSASSPQSPGPFLVNSSPLLMSAAATAVQTPAIASASPDMPLASAAPMFRSPSPLPLGPSRTVVRGRSGPSRSPSRSVSPQRLLRPADAFSPAPEHNVLPAGVRLRPGMVVNRYAVRTAVMAAANV